MGIDYFPCLNVTERQSFSVNRLFGAGRELRLVRHVDPEIPVPQAKVLRVLVGLANFPETIVLACGCGILSGKFAEPEHALFPACDTGISGPASRTHKKITDAQ